MVVGYLNVTTPAPEEDTDMGLVILLLVLALIFGGVGLFVEGLKWALIVALVLLVISAFSGFSRRGRAI